MVTKKQIRLVRDLQQKKYRNEHGLFVAEGVKIVKELLDAGFESLGIYSSISGMGKELDVEVSAVDQAVIKKMSALTNPNGLIGVFKIKESKEIDTQDWILALDAVRDPGNLGTIIRLCDWYGIRQLVCSPDTVDCYNPKVLQATMGSIARVNIAYTDLTVFLEKYEQPIYGAFMDGSNVYGQNLPQKGVLVMGNEANGISEGVETRVNEKIAIPQFGKPTTESLNVASATAILLNEVRRNSLIRK